MTDKTSPKYNVAIVEAVTLEITAELHPLKLTAKELERKVISNVGDAREVETLAQAIRGLREFGLFTVRDDEIVELTPVAIHVVALLA
jgi:hypothetical protein